MRKVLSVFAGGALAIMLSAPAAHAAGSDRYRPEQHRCHPGLIGRVLDDLLYWL